MGLGTALCASASFSASLQARVAPGAACVIHRLCVVNAGATHISPERTLPVLVRIPEAAAGNTSRDEDGKADDAPIAGSGPIIDYLASSSEAARADAGDGLVSLSPTQAADMEAYTAMVEQKL